MADRPVEKSTSVIVSPVTVGVCGDECAFYKVSGGIQQELIVLGDSTISGYVELEGNRLDILVEEYNVPGLVWAEHWADQWRIGISGGAAYKRKVGEGAFEISLGLAAQYNLTNETRETWVECGVNYWSKTEGPIQGGVGLTLDIPLQKMDHPDPGRTDFNSVFIGGKLFAAFDIL